jgi:tetratricopeptide (TPR) repeat protein
MARTAAAGFESHLRKLARRRCHWPSSLAALLILFGLTLSTACTAAEAVKGEATFSVADGYARLVFKLAADVGTEVTTAGSILVIRFNRPVDIAVDRLPESAPDYVSSARRDPDGSAIRLSLVRKVTVSTMAAGERVFVDMLPEGWNGPPPSLPMEVVRELAERARVAERALRLQRAEAEAKRRPPIRVRALVQPTFVRFVFEMPDGVGASSVLNDQKLTLQFNAILNFDLADAKIAAPPNVAAINQKVDTTKTMVEIALIGDVDVHSFREDKNYIIDVAFEQPEKARQLPSPTADAGHDAKPAADASHGPKPAAPASIVVAAKPAARESVPEPQASEIVQPTSETIARQMKADAKPDAPAKAASMAASTAVVEAPKSEHAAAAASASAGHTAQPPASPAVKPVETAEAEPKPGAAEPKPGAAQPKPGAAEPKSGAAEPKPGAVESKPGVAEKPGAPDVKPVAVETKRAAADAKPEPADTTASVEAMRDSDGLRLTFSFAGPTPAASFRRGDTVWLVFDSTAPFDLAPIRAKGGSIIGEVSRVPLEAGQAIRIRLNRPQMHSLSTDERASGASWTVTFAEKVLAPPQPLSVLRNVNDPALANVVVGLANPGLLHRLTDPEAGDTLMVVTAPPPIRGFIKRQDFVDFSLLDSAQGVAIRPNAEDVAVERAPDKIILGKPGGLTLSSVGVSAERAPTALRPLFDIDEWHTNQNENFVAREDALVQAAASAEPDRRSQARLDLARFYMARAMYAEARGVTNLILSDADPRTEESVVLMVHAVASILMGRPEQALKDFASPVVGNNYDSQLWKGLAYARQGKWGEAREKFKNVEFAIASLPLELQRIVTMDAMRASLEVKDYAGAAKRRAELDVVGLQPELEPAYSVLRGRLAEALAQDKDALDDYTFAVKSSDREAAAEAKQLEIALKQRRKEISPPDALRELETLAVTWRGDTTELKTLQMLSLIYNEAGRYPEALAAARSASKLQPNSEISRQAQDAASTLFSDIFLSAKGDELPPIEALGMFYEFRELTPIGRRGDEMIRRLADRLAAIDLLDQAAELLQYQVDKRLEGAARAQVAARLAMVYLTNRKPDRAISALRSTRIADLNGELRQQRLLLEARAQSDVGRHDLALDILSNISGREAVRLRSDIYWAARQWRESSEQIELYYGDRWRDFKPLDSAERSDVIRAVVGYALADDAIGLSRFREKYAPLMTGEADKLAFDIASTPATGSSAEFTQIAKMAASVDTLEGFLREMKLRFPDNASRPASPDGARAEPPSTGTLPEIAGMRRVGGTGQMLSSRAAASEEVRDAGHDAAHGK